MLLLNYDLLPSRWLKPGGAVLPDIATLWVAAAGSGAAGLDFWDDVYGFTMAPVAAAIRGDSMQKAVVAVVPSKEVRAYESLRQKPLNDSLVYVCDATTTLEF